MYEVYIGPQEKKSLRDNIKSYILLFILRYYPLCHTLLTEINYNL